MSKFNKATSLVTLLACAIPAGQALAGAWTLPTGDVQVGVTYTYSEATAAFDEDGNRGSDADFFSHQLSILLQYGVFDYLTAYAEINLRSLDVDGITEQGHEETDIGLRLRVLEQGQHVFSLQGEVTLPGDIDSFENVTLNQGEIEAELRALYGATFSLGAVPAFIGIEGAYRYREGAPADEFHADISFGFSPERGVEVLFESLNVWSDGDGDTPAFPNYQQHKVQGSLLFHMTEALSLQLGGFYTWYGESVIAEEGVFAAVRYGF